MDMTPAHHVGQARRGTRGGDLLSGPIVRRAMLDALAKLDPRRLVRNPVIFVTEVVAILVTVLAGRALALGQPWGFQAAIASWLCLGLGYFWILRKGRSSWHDLYSESQIVQLPKNIHKK